MSRNPSNNPTEICASIECEERLKRGGPNLALKISHPQQQQQQQQQQQKGLGIHSPRLVSSLKTSSSKNNNNNNEGEMFPELLATPVEGPENNLAPVPCSPQIAKRTLKLPKSRAHSRSVSMDLALSTGADGRRVYNPLKKPSFSELASMGVTSPLRQDLLLPSPPLSIKSAGSSIMVETPDEMDEEELHPLNFISTEGGRLIGDYELLEYIDRGSFSTVWKVRRKGEQKCFAMKLVDMENGPSEQRVTNELTVLKELQGHPSVIRLIEVVQIPSPQRYTGIVMELMEGGNLYNWCINQIQAMALTEVVSNEQATMMEQTAHRIFHPLLQAVSWMHQKGWVHRDLKLENILLTLDGNPKLCDFGLAVPCKNTVSIVTAAGSDEYLSPEIVLSAGGGGSVASNGKPVDPRTDIWSLGVILYALLHGRMPFIRRPGQTRRSFLYQIAMAEVRYSPYISEPARDMLNAMLKRKPSERKTGEELLNFPWITSC